MVYFFVAVLALGILIARYNQTRKKSVTPESLMRTIHEHFHGHGNQVKARDLMEKIDSLNRAVLEKNKSYFEFYPNDKVITLNTPTAILFCRCNLIEYLDLTLGIDKILRYGVSPVVAKKREFFPAEPKNSETKPQDNIPRAA